MKSGYDLWICVDFKSTFCSHLKPSGVSRLDVDYVRKRESTLGKYALPNHTKRKQQPAFSILPPVETR